MSTRFSKTGRRALMGLAVAVALSVPAPAQGLTIRLNAVGTGILGTSGTAVVPAPVLRGGGSLGTVMAAAAAYWEAIIGDAGTLHVDFGWVDHGAALAAATQHRDPRSLLATGRAGDIGFDATGRTWFADATPFDAGEYAARTETRADLGGGTMVTGRAHALPTGAAAGAYDLFTVAVHELAHLLGLADLGFRADEAFFRGDTDGDGLPDIAPGTMTAGPFAGAVLPLHPGSAHLDPAAFPDALMQLWTGPELRRLAGDADIAALAQLSGFADIDYAAASLGAAPESAVAEAPLPGGALLLVSALGALGLARSMRAQGRPVVPSPSPVAPSPSRLS